MAKSKFSFIIYCGLFIYICLLVSRVLYTLKDGRYKDLILILLTVEFSLIIVQTIVSIDAVLKASDSCWSFVELLGIPVFVVLVITVFYSWKSLESEEKLHWHSDPHQCRTLHCASSNLLVDRTGVRLSSLIDWNTFNRSRVKRFAQFNIESLKESISGDFNFNMLNITFNDTSLFFTNIKQLYEAIGVPPEVVNHLASNPNALSTILDVLPSGIRCDLWIQQNCHPNKPAYISAVGIIVLSFVLIIFKALTDSAVKKKYYEKIRRQPRDIVSPEMIPAPQVVEKSFSQRAKTAFARNTKSAISSTHVTPFYHDDVEETHRALPVILPPLDDDVQSVVRPIRPTSGASKAGYEYMDIEHEHKAPLPAIPETELYLKVI